ncbi:hypothetical protein H634G_09128 [Metarhizium anisopliae BRIP 53293]|uniref:Uncharacterized protein n=1 Tax=Metarhizium anisopliae BRIP 53293 TaxID=1291518 RepID=A0A0D9NP83_METAN|nr:hypothetical protein H634G_09128 [Metarhizium anisopliae BRIP 53293]
MTGPPTSPRYSAEDFETASVRSAAPSYVSDTPSYHTLPYNHNETIPPYSPPAPRAAPLAASASAPLFAPGRHGTSSTRQQTIGLPPLPPVAPQGAMSIHNFHLPTWSANNGPAARHYRNVAERRITSGRYTGPAEPLRHQNPNDRALNNGTDTAPEARPLEDPYLVGEVAAAQARRERLARESSDDILVREDRQWDWLLAQMRSWDERERNWARFRREVEHTQRKKLLRRIGGRLLPT